VPEKAAGLIEALGRIGRRLKLDTSGTTIPITIKGTREKPVFRVDVGVLKCHWRGAIGLSHSSHDPSEWARTR